MRYPEIAWRTRAAGRIVADRVASTFTTPHWDRSDLIAALADVDELDAVRTALRGRQWSAAHIAFCRYFVDQPARFIVAPSDRESRAAQIRERFPGGVQDAVKRADRLLNGQYDLLGHRGLRFAAPPQDEPSSSTPATIDWLYDPVSHRRLPAGYWAAIDYLDARGADHKVVWELNRHQHWLTLGRAFWLAGDWEYRVAFVEQLTSWIAGNPPLMTANWSSMLELAFRALSWTWGLNFFASDVPENEPPWTIDLLMALDRQLTHIERNLSCYFSPNTHLLGEGLALYVTGRALPALRRSGARQKIGRRVLLDEISRQIETDGGHCERSTHYHRYALDFYLLALAVARITGDAAEPAFADAASRLADAATILADGRGRFPHVGDDDGGMLFPICGREADDIRDSLAISSVLLGRPDLRIGDVPEEAYWLISDGLDRLKPDPAFDPCNDRLRASSALPATGYYVSRSPAGDHLLIDAGPHGYQNGGHAHADALSMTLTVGGLPLLIDAGTGCYTIDMATRDRFRSTASHNTLVVDNRPQSLPAGPFHWDHTAGAMARRWCTGARFDYFEGAHDGYRPLEHRRHLFVMHGDLMVVIDLVAGAGSHSAMVYWHVDPRWHVDVTGRRATFKRSDAGDGPDRAPKTIDMMVADGTLEQFAGDSTTGLGWYSPVYGRIEPATTLRITRQAATPLWVATAFGFDPDNPIVDVEQVPVWAEAGALAHSAGLRIARLRSTDYFLIAERATGIAGGTWRIGEFETDASMFFARSEAHRITQAELVDGTFAHADGHPELADALPDGLGGAPALERSMPPLPRRA